MARTATICRIPSTSEELPWNVGLHDDEANDPDGYVESVGARTHAEAVKMADAWIWEGRSYFPHSWFETDTAKGVE